jgi:hypothetical protein
MGRHSLESLDREAFDYDDRLGSRRRRAFRQNASIGRLRQRDFGGDGATSSGFWKIDSLARMEEIVRKLAGGADYRAMLKKKERSRRFRCNGDAS